MNKYIGYSDKHNINNKIITIQLNKRIKLNNEQEKKSKYEY